MSAQMNARHRIAIAAWTLLLSLPAAAQSQADFTAAMTRFTAAQNVPIRAIAMDPCNAKPKIPDMVKQLEGPAKEARAGLDGHVDMFNIMADTGCANQGKAIPEIELYLVAGALLYLDACTYSPGKDYSIELKMARGSYSTRSFAAFMKYALEKPCMREFIAAQLTGKAPAQAAPDAAAPPAAAPPPTRRRTN